MDGVLEPRYPQPLQLRRDCNGRLDIEHPMAVHLQPDIIARRRTHRREALQAHRRNLEYLIDRMRGPHLVEGVGLQNGEALPCRAIRRLTEVRRSAALLHVAQIPIEVGVQQLAFFVFPAERLRHAEAGVPAL